MMRRRAGLTRFQKICIVVLWMVLCALLFLYSEKSLGENIFIAIASGLIIVVGISNGLNKYNRDNNRRGR